MTERKRRQGMRLYKGVAVCALLAGILWPAVFVLQCVFAGNTIEELLSQGADFSGVIQWLLELLDEPGVSLVYDLPHLPGMPILVPFLVLFAAVCLKAKDREWAKRYGCLVIGMGLECYAALSFFMHIVMAVTLYYTEWSAGESDRVILRILFAAFGSGFAELAMISLFAVSLIVTGCTRRYRPLAVSAGAICFFRLFEDSLWLVTGVFDGTLFSAPAIQIAHGILFLVAMSLTFLGAVLVAMSSPKEGDEDDREGRTA